MAYPIFDPIHVIIPLIPTLNYFLNNAHLNKKMISISFAIFIIAVFSYNIININNNFAYPNSTIAFKYRKMNGNVETSINEVTEYLKNSEEKVYIIDVYAYLIKLNANEKIDKYDLLNNGNLGKNGEKVIIKELDNYCKKNKCKFLIYKAAINNRQYSQYNQEIYSYIIDNYDEKDKVLNLTIYSNY